MSNNDWKERLGVVYSTSNNFDYNYEEEEQEETIAPKQQDLRVSLDKKQRKGKKVTLVTGFVGSDEDLKDLGKQLKSKCGTGGSTKDKEIIIQGDFREKIMQILTKEGYKVKQSGG